MMRLERTWPKSSVVRASLSSWENSSSHRGPGDRRSQGTGILGLPDGPAHRTIASPGILLRSSWNHREAFKLVELARGLAWLDVVVLDFCRESTLLCAKASPGFLPTG